MTPVQAVGGIASGHRVFIGTGPAEPESLVQAMTAKAAALRDVHDHPRRSRMGPAPLRRAGVRAGASSVTTFFIAPNVREAVADGRADFVPVFLHETAAAVRRAVSSTGRWSS